MIDSNMQDSIAATACCNVCGSDASHLLVEKDGHQVLCCTECGLAFTHPQPQALDQQYDSSYFHLYRRRRHFRLKRSDERLKRIELLITPGKLLDIGCSLGYFVEAANRRGWRASGIEISPAASEEAAALGLDVQCGAIEDARFADESFDCVTMWDVLEHVPDPTRHMSEVNRILSPGGVVAIGTPDLGHIAFKIQRERWRHLKPSEHIFYFNKECLSRLLDKTGFDFVIPPVLGGRSFAGSLAAALKCNLARLVRVNDVLTVYCVKR